MDSFPNSGVEVNRGMRRIRILRGRIAGGGENFKENPVRVPLYRVNAPVDCHERTAFRRPRRMGNLVP
jgi:hypothetical protein